MTCRVPPATLTLFEQANQKWPGRNRASDGACPSRAHSANSPTSDHEADPRVGNYSCAADLTHDPAHGADVHGWVSEHVIRDPRVKYVVRHRGGVDEIWNNQLGDRHWRRLDAHDHASHLHISYWHDRRNLEDTRAWFGPMSPPVQQEDEEVELVILQPDAPLRSGDLKGKTPTVLALGGTKLAFHLDADQLKKVGELPHRKVPAAFVESLVIISTHAK